MEDGREWRRFERKPHYVIKIERWFNRICMSGFRFHFSWVKCIKSERKCAKRFSFYFKEKVQLFYIHWAFLELTEIMGLEIFLFSNVCYSNFTLELLLQKVRSFVRWQRATWERRKSFFIEFSSLHFPLQFALLVSSSSLRFINKQNTHI